MSDLMVSVNKTIHAPIEKVFDAWLNPKMLAQFILPMPGMPQPEVTNNPVQGGSFTIVMHVGEDKIPHTGKYLEVNRPHKLVFSWVSPFSTDGSTVTILFNETTEGDTNIQLTHVKFADEETRSNHEGGWSNILDTLNDVMSLAVAG